MGDIRECVHVIFSSGYWDGNHFTESISQQVGILQGHGLSVEIQYGQSDNAISALIIGREK